MLLESFVYDCKFKGPTQIVFRIFLDYSSPLSRMMLHSLSQSKGITASMTLLKSSKLQGELQPGMLSLIGDLEELLFMYCI